MVVIAQFGTTEHIYARRYPCAYKLACIATAQVVGRSVTHIVEGCGVK